MELISSNGLVFDEFETNVLNNIWKAKRRYLEDEYLVFDYPDYGGLTDDIINKLSGDFVDSIQIGISEFKYHDRIEDWVNSIPKYKD